MSHCIEVLNTDMYSSKEKSYAGFWRRTGAMLIDSAVYSVLLLLLLGPAYVNSSFYTQEGFTSTLLVFVLTIGLWMRYNGTPGKLLLGCQIVDASSFEPISLKQSVIRYLGYYVSLICLGVGFFWVMWDKRKQGFHDKLAKTVVVYDSDLEMFDESQKSLDQLISELR